MGNNWSKRHEHESPEFNRRSKERYKKWWREHRERFPTDEEYLDHIRKKMGWPKYNKYQRNVISMGEGVKDE